MRIAIVTRKLSGRGGMETVIRTLVEAGRQGGDRIEVWLMGIPERQEWLTDIPHRMAAIDQGTGRRFQLKVKLPFYIRALTSLMQQHPVDAVLATDPVFVRAALHARKRLSPLPAVFSWLHFSLNALANVRYLVEADGHLAISSAISEQLRNLPVKASPTLVFNPLPAIPDVINVPPKAEPRFLYVGRLNNRQKRVDVLLQAFAQHLGRSWQLVVVGDGPDRPMLQETAEKLAMGSRIEWRGWTDDPWSPQLHVTALCLTSDYEGFPMVLLEALARGIPVIATDCPTGPRDIVQPGKNGFLCRPSDPAAFAAHIERFLGDTSPCLEWSAQTIRDRVVTQFSPSAVLSKIRDTIERALEKIG